MKGVNHNALHMRRERMDCLRIGRWPYNKGHRPGATSFGMVYNRGGKPRFAELLIDRMRGVTRHEPRRTT